jgi:hypothetical protein
MGIGMFTRKCGEKNWLSTLSDSDHEKGEASIDRIWLDKNNSSL